MRNRGQRENEEQDAKEPALRLPTPSASFRRRGWLEFQRALDPLAPIKQLPPPRA